MRAEGCPYNSFVCVAPTFAGEETEIKGREAFGSGTAQSSASWGGYQGSWLMNPKDIQLGQGRIQMVAASGPCLTLAFSMAPKKLFPPMIGFVSAMAGRTGKNKKEP